MKHWLLALLIVPFAMSCSQGTRKSGERAHRSVYYWKTTFNYGDQERAFVEEQGIDRIYLRLFDVGREDWSGPVVPIATVQFKTPVPEDIDIVPVVYIDNDVVSHLSDYDSLLYARVIAIAKQNKFPDLKEIQLDCDWAEGTQNAFFAFCKKIKHLAKADGIEISATIRLHQLKKAAPPVDRGVLMLYNTGSLYDPATKNSILDYQSVAPYLKSATSYKLPLSYAYPFYEWGVVMTEEGEFSKLLHNTDVLGDTLFHQIGPNLYQVKEDCYIGDENFWEGSIVRREMPDIKTMLRVKRLVEDRLGLPEGNIVYHFDADNLSKYDKADIKRVLK